MEPRFIIAISGKQRSGKDTFATILKEKLRGMNFVKVSLATPLKQIVAFRMGISVECLERIKTDPEIRKKIIDASKPMLMVDRECMVKMVKDMQHNLIIPDVRRLYELESLAKDSRTLVTVRLDAPRDVRAERGTLSNEQDPTECELDDYEGWDFVFNTVRFSHLYNYADLVVDYIQSQS